MTPGRKGGTHVPEMRAPNHPVAEHVASMNDETVYRRMTARMFKSGLMEPFSRVHPVIPLLIYAPVVVWFLIVAARLLGPLALLGSVLGGVLVWSFTEYTMHRFVFHVEPNTPFKRWLYFYTHGIHHAYPDDYFRLVMVPTISLPLALIFYGLFALLLPAAVLPAFFAGFVVGYLLYDYSHFATHHVRPPKHAALAALARVLKVSRRRHMRHHFADHHRGFGVSTELWDHVFGTVLPETGDAVAPDA